MNFIIGTIFALVGAVANAIAGNWMTAFWCVAAAGWAIIAYFEKRDARRYKALAMARRSWPGIGTIQRTDAGGCEVWDGKTWVKV